MDDKEVIIDSFVFDLSLSEGVVELETFQLNMAEGWVMDGSRNTYLVANRQLDQHHWVFMVYFDTIPGTAPYLVADICLHIESGKYYVKRHNWKARKLQVKQHYTYAVLRNDDLHEIVKGVWYVKTPNALRQLATRYHWKQHTPYLAQLLDASLEEQLTTFPVMVVVGANTQSYNITERARIRPVNINHIPGWVKL